MKTGDFQMPFFGENYFAAATSLTGLRRAGHSIWRRSRRPDKARSCAEEIDGIGLMYQDVSTNYAIERIEVGK